jgi:hypothetical protein
MHTNREALERFLGPPVAHQARRPGWREHLRAADSTAQTEPNRALSPSIATTASRLSDANRSSIPSKDQQQPLRVDQVESNSARSRFNALLRSHNHSLPSPEVLQLQRQKQQDRDDMVSSLFAGTTKQQQPRATQAESHIIGSGSLSQTEVQPLKSTASLSSERAGRCRSWPMTTWPLSCCSSAP